MLKVLSKCKVSSINNNRTLHSKVERKDRYKAYSNLLSRQMLYCFIVDTEHKNGLEVHCINVNGLIYIYNKTSKNLVTIIHPRPSQLKRYFRQLDMCIPQYIRELAHKCHERNEKQDYNNK